MTKRFTYIKNNSISQYSVLPIQEIGGKTYHCQGIVDKLNKLTDENEQLKSDIQLHIEDSEKYRKLSIHFDNRNKEVVGTNALLEKENEQLKSSNMEYEDALARLEEKNEQLKQENREYKALLQDMGMLMSDEDVMNIRNEIADKFLKTLFKDNGFDVNIDTTDGFTIIPKGDVE